MPTYSLKCRSIFAALIVTSSSCALAASAPSYRVAVSSGAKQTGTVGSTLPAPLIAIVTNTSGALAPNVQVDWTVTGGEGSLQAFSTISDANGLAANTYILGVVSGANKATATIHGTTRSASFAETANPGPAQSVSPLSGNEQSGVVGAALPSSLSVICRDLYGNPSSHAEVDWAVTSGGGSVAYAYSLTQAGIATKTLVLGIVPGVNTVTATIQGTSTSYTFTAKGLVGAAAALQVTAGNSQTGMPGKTLPLALTVTAVDAYGNPKSGVRVTWTAATGDSFSSTSNSTGSSGQASSSLKLSDTFGLHQATAVIQGTAIAQKFTATEGVNAVITMQDNPNPNPKALQPYFLGLSYQKTWASVPLLDTKNLALVSLYKRLGPGVIRIVAEQPVTPIVWNHSGRGLQYGTISEADLVRLAAFLKATDWKIIYGIALIGNKASCTAGDTHCAADEAAVAARAFGSSLLGFEIGNEPDNYTNASYGNPPTPQLPGYTFDDFISTSPVYRNGQLLPSWPAFASAIRAAAPNAPLAGPAGGFDWATRFAASNQASQVTLLTRHYYQSSKVATPAMADLLTPDTRVPVQFPQLAEAALAANISGGYRIAECNGYSGSHPGVTDAFGAALWTIDFLFDNAFFQSSGVNFHGGASGPSFSPIYDNGTSVTSIRPDYYGMVAYSMLARDGDLMLTQVSPSIKNFSAYTVVQPDGSTDVILSNKDPLKSLTVGVAAQGHISQANTLLLTASSLTATSGFLFGGSPIQIDGSWSPVSNPAVPIVNDSAIVTVPPGSAQIVHMQ